MYTLHSRFGINKHKETFINYCEVIIEPSGDICYAIPSHVMYLEKYGSRIYSETVEEFANRCPDNMYYNYIQWLVDATRCICCWPRGYMSCKNTTEEQKHSLKLLIDNDLVEDRVLG